MVFCSAKRNNNSSRFGKYNRVFFDETGTLVDASVTTYLLESSRVVLHGRKERTYHCFYEMLRGLPEERLKALNLQRDRSYVLLNSEGDSDVSEKAWHKQFEEPVRIHFYHLYLFPLICIHISYRLYEFNYND